ETRIGEFKSLVKALHQKGIRVIMDVVYNHTGKSLDSDLNKIVPYYYYRSKNGKLSNASECGNETASERAMFRKLMIESVVFWATEYHLDGFRFDLMGIHDLETMRAIRKALDLVDPSILIYGEGWIAGKSPLEEERRAVKKNTIHLDRIGSFSDDLRDAIKGHVFENEAKGFVNGGDPLLEESIRFGIAGACSHPQINYKKINYSKAPWAKEASQSINYAEAHDNLTLYDKLKITNPTDSEEEIAAMIKMSGALFILAQGIPFIHAGMEFMRTKQGDHNSYRSSDAINQIDWALKSKNFEVFRYYQGLIALRKAHALFRLNHADEIAKKLHFLHLPGVKKGGVLGYQIKGNHHDSVVVLFNARREQLELPIPKGTWRVVGNREGIEPKGWMTINEEYVKIKELETIILVSQER
ncbi:MAG: type I pullulanase, partial [Vallitaleaceae bacterium]|nr:type I pullulanase [Vallitaleaceae bacterium]